jgi:hypothetical protein
MTSPGGILKQVLVTGGMLPARVKVCSAGAMNFEKQKEMPDIIWPDPCIADIEKEIRKVAAATLVEHPSLESLSKPFATVCIEKAIW